MKAFEPTAFGAGFAISEIVESRSSQIDDAIIGLLQADLTLRALLPDGVWWNVARQNATQFCVVSIADSQDSPGFGIRAWEATAYQIVAIEQSTTGARATAAADRIDYLLEGADLRTASYNCVVRRDGGRVHDTVPDDVEKSIRWQLRGARYLVTAFPKTDDAA